MGVSTAIFLSAICLLLILCAQSVKVTYLTTSSEQFGEYVQKSFGMAERGLITIHYNVYPQDSSLPYDSYVLLLVLNNAQQKNWYSALDDSSIDGDNINSLCSQPSLRRIEAWGEQKLNITIDESIGSNLFSVAVLQCRTGYASNPVTVSVKLHMVNARPEGDGHSHLPIQFVMLTRVYEGFLIAYVLLLLGLAAQFYFASRDGQTFVLPVHHMFLLTLACKIIWVALEYYDMYRYNKHGEEDDSVDIAANVFEAFTSTSALTTLFLLSMGWSVLRERLAAKEARFVNMSMLTYFIFAFGSALCIDGDATSCQALSLVSFVIRSLVLLAIIIAMNFTVTQLRAMLTHTPWVPSTPLQYARCKQFQMFRVVFIIYLLVPTAFLLVEVTTYSWREQWLVTLLNEATDLLFFFHLGVTFSPMYEPLLTRAFDGSLHRAE